MARGECGRRAAGGRPGLVRVRAVRLGFPIPLVRAYLQEAACATVFGSVQSY